MSLSTHDDLIRQMNESVKEGDYWKQIAVQSGKQRLREAETLSSIIQNLKQVKKNLTNEIKERQRIEKELRASEAKYRSIMESISDAVYLISMDFHIEYLNPAMIRRVSRNPIGCLCYKAIFDRSEKCPWCPIDQVQKGLYTEYDFLDPKNKQYYEVASTPVHHADGNFSMLSISRDVTEKKAIETELRQSRKMESIGLLAGGVAHDFNNILQVILGNTALSLDSLDNGGPVYDNLKAIQKASTRASEIVRQLLNFSRNAESVKKPIEIISIIKETLGFLKATLPNTTEIRGIFPDNDIIILGDATQIAQILINTCTNASQAMEQTGGILDIIVELPAIKGNIAENQPNPAENKFVNITIRDAGSGIDPAIIDRIFDPYFSTKEVGKGSGMGLAVVHGIVKNHGGSITVDSWLGEGTAFKILLPVIHETSEKNEGIDERMQCQHGTESILFIDDEQFIAEMAKDLFGGLGYSIETKTNPIEALELFQSNPYQFDLVITDMTMPKMTGVSVYKEMKNVRADIPVIICTGYSALIDEKEAEKLGISAYIMKPFSLQDMAETIRNVLDGSVKKA